MSRRWFWTCWDHFFTSSLSSSIWTTCFCTHFYCSWKYSFSFNFFTYISSLINSLTSSFVSTFCETLSSSIWSLIQKDVLVLISYVLSKICELLLSWLSICNKMFSNWLLICVSIYSRVLICLHIDDSLAFSEANYSFSSAIYFSYYFLISATCTSFYCLSYISTYSADSIAFWTARLTMLVIWSWLSTSISEALLSLFVDCVDSSSISDCICCSADLIFSNRVSCEDNSSFCKWLSSIIFAMDGRLA